MKGQGRHQGDCERSRRLSSQIQHLNLAAGDGRTFNKSIYSQLGMFFLLLFYNKQIHKIVIIR